MPGVLLSFCTAALAVTREGTDWQHALQVAQDLRADPPKTPVTLLLGGSCAREATVNDKSWTTAVRSAGSSAAVTYNLSSRNQTFEQETALVRALPRAPMIVFIGINRGRFTAPPTTTTSVTPRTTKGKYAQHSYSAKGVRPLAKKEEVVAYWMRQRYPVFQERLVANLARLDSLLALCKQRGLYPVLLELPRNDEVIGYAFSEPMRQYQEGCRELATRHEVPYLDFIGDLGLVNEDFYDLDHLVEPGREKFQRRLADETDRLLRQYELAAGIETSRIAGDEDVDDGSSVMRILSRPRLAWLFGLAVLAGVALAVQRRRTVIRRRRARERARRRARAGRSGGARSRPPRA